MYLRRQLFIAFLYGVKAGKRPKQGKVRRPYMGRYVDCFRAGIQCNGQKVMTVKSEDGTPVRMDVADGFQASGKYLGILQAGKKNQAVYLPYLVIFLVDRADFPADYKPWLRASCGTRVADHPLFFQDIESGLGRFQLFGQFGPPGRMGEIACPNYVNPLFPGPKVQIFRCQVLAGGSGIMGMDV